MNSSMKTMEANPNEFTPGCLIWLTRRYYPSRSDLRYHCGHQEAAGELLSVNFVLVGKAHSKHLNRSQRTHVSHE